MEYYFVYNTVQYKNSLVSATLHISDLLGCVKHIKKVGKNRRSLIYLWVVWSSELPFNTQLCCQKTIKSIVKFITTV